jgi:hypothetical protein
MESLLRSDVLRGVSHESVVREGDVDQVLKHLIQSRAIDLVVMGTQGCKGSMWKLQLGSWIKARLSDFHAIAKVTDRLPQSRCCGRDLQELAN